MFHYSNKILHAESVDLQELAEQYGTPLYVYSHGVIARQYQRYQKAFETCQHLICYAVKANNNLDILSCLARMGAGFDVVSGGELERVLKSGGNPKQVVFSGIAKSAQEMQRALEVGIYCFNIESAGELERLSEVATTHGMIANIAIRINPDIQAGGHPHVQTGTADSKFGVLLANAEDLYLRAADLPSIAIRGIDFHIGSQINDFMPLVEALKHILELKHKLEARDIQIKHIDIGGGLGVYHNPHNPYGATDIENYGTIINKLLQGTEVQLLLEPGRSLLAPAGILLTRIQYLKSGQNKQFAIVDAGMSHFIRPALYNAQHPIIELKKHDDGTIQNYDVVGPICESADVLAKQCPLNIKNDDLLAVCIAGAYGSVMASNYNDMPRAAEVMVRGNNAGLIRQRQTITDMWRQENILSS